jgi:hypothetical protein
MNIYIYSYTTYVYIYSHMSHIVWYEERLINHAHSRDAHPNNNLELFTWFLKWAKLQKHCCSHVVATCCNALIFFVLLPLQSFEFVFKWVIVGWNSRAFKREWATFPSQRYAYAFAERFTWPQHFDMSRITVSISTHWGTLCTMTTTNCVILWTKLKSFNIDMVSILHFHMHVTHLKMDRFLQDWYWQIDIQKENRNPL